MAVPEDLINVVIAADDLRRRARGQTSTRAARALRAPLPSRKRRFIEPVFNLLGIFWGEIMTRLPWRLRKPLVQWVNRKMSGRALQDIPELPERTAQVLRLAQEVKAKSGHWPALLALLSHPDTEGPFEWLRFELVRQGLQIADAYTEVRRQKTRFWPHPKCVLAIDPYALDTVSPVVGGFYGGWMHRFYIAWDRQPSTQSWIQKHFLLRGTGYEKIIWRLLSWLKKDVPVLMVLSGGLPYNARLLYGAREFVHRLKPARWTVSKRQAQIELMEILMQPEGDIWPADKGILPEATAQRVRGAMAKWGIPSEKIDGLLKEFTEEFKRAVPYRARLVRVLARRLAERGKPLILVPVSHQEAPPHVEIAPPVLLEDPNAVIALG